MGDQGAQSFQVVTGILNAVLAGLRASEPSLKLTG
jgi:hypothetical protein